MSLSKAKAQNLIHEAELRANRSASADLKKQVEFWMKKSNEADRRLDVALDLKKHSRIKVPVVSPSQSGASKSVAFMVGSDWHVEETVDPRTVNGKNEFGLTIADRRIGNFFSNGQRLVDIQRSGTDIDTLVLTLLGDHMTGYIHEELIEGNSLSPTETILWLLPRIEAGIRFLLQSGGYKKVYVMCSMGNHGRTTIKKRVATHYKNSYEWMMYHILAQRFAGNQSVEFRIPFGYHNLFDCYGRIIRFHHGDAIKYQGGIGGLYIPANKAIGEWNKGTAAYLDVFGHWHQQKDGGSFISNGSLIGYNAYAVEIKASPEPPQQAFFLINEKKGKTIVAPIWLENE